VRSRASPSSPGAWRRCPQALLARVEEIATAPTRPVVGHQISASVTGLCHVASAVIEFCSKSGVFCFRWKVFYLWRAVPQLMAAWRYQVFDWDFSEHQRRLGPSISAAPAGQTVANTSEWPPAALWFLHP